MKNKHKAAPSLCKEKAYLQLNIICILWIKPSDDDLHFILCERNYQRVYKEMLFIEASKAQMCSNIRLVTDVKSKLSYDSLL